jgi:hypothetical protein
MTPSSASAAEFRRWTLRWRGAVIGYLEEPRVDMWWVYGRWVSAQHPVEPALWEALEEQGDQWLEALREGTTPLRVLLIQPPEDCILEVRLQPGSL